MVEALLLPRPERYWKHDRFVIGPSDIAVVLNRSDYQTARQLGEVMLGIRAPNPDSYATLRGKALEATLAWWYERRTGFACREVDEQREHFLHPWLRYSIDRAVDTHGEACQRGFEGKIRQGTKGFGEPGTDQVPIDVYYQCQLYCYLEGAPEWDVVAEVRGRPDLWTVHYDRDLVLTELLPAGASFVELIQAGELPEPTQIRDLQPYGTVLEALEADGAALMDAQDCAKHRAARDAYERDREACEFRLRRLLTDHGADVLVHEGERLCTYFQDRNGKRRFRLCLEEE